MEEDKKPEAVKKSTELPEGKRGAEAAAQGKAVSEMTELELENQRLREENERLRQLEEYRKTLSPKERLYDHISVSVKTMDCMIAVLVILFIIVVVLGMIK